METAADTQFVQLCAKLPEHSILFTKNCKPSELMEYTPLSTKAKDTLCLPIILKAISTSIALFTTLRSVSSADLSRTGLGEEGWGVGIGVAGGGGGRVVGHAVPPV